MSILRDAQRRLEVIREKTDKILVSYSDGKDSRVVLDLCAKMFPTVAGFHLTLVPGLECIDVALEQARRRYGIIIREYVHPMVSRLLQDGIYCDPQLKEDVPDVKLGHVYAVAAVDAGIDWIAVGFKRSDSSSRRNMMKLFKPDHVVYPVLGWNDYDIKAYLKGTGIGVPLSSGGRMTGMDLSDENLLWMHQTFPADFAKICEVFPYAEAVVWRSRFFPETIGA